MLTALIADPCRVCGNDEIQIDDDAAFERFIDQGGRPDDFDLLESEQALICTRCGTEQ